MQGFPSDLSGGYTNSKSELFLITRCIHVAFPTFYSIVYVSYISQSGALSTKNVLKSKAFPVYT